jgi:hypothetical protein
MYGKTNFRVVEILMPSGRFNKMNVWFLEQ